jgi:hypothetical protein
MTSTMETDRIASSDKQIEAGAITLNGLGLSKFTSNNETEILISGVNVGSATTDFNFEAIVGGKLITKTIAGPVAATMTMSDLLQH